MTLLPKLADELVRLRRYALLLTRNRDDAEDLVQDALLRAIAGAATWKPETELRPWLFAILHNVFATGARNFRRRAQLGMVGWSALVEDAVPANQVDRVELLETARALDLLPEDQRQAMLLIAVESMSYQEAAAILDVPLGTLMSRLARGRTTLRQMTGREERGRLTVVR